MKRILSIAIVLVVFMATMFSAVKRFHCDDLCQEPPVSCCALDPDADQNDGEQDSSGKHSHHDCHSSHRPIVLVLDEMVHIQLHGDLVTKVFIQPENQRIPKGPYLDLEKPPII